MLRIHFSWGLNYDLPEYDPEIHDPKEVFAMLCYRGVHYAKWVRLDTFKINNWFLHNPRQTEN